MGNEDDRRPPGTATLAPGDGSDYHVGGFYLAVLVYTRICVRPPGAAGAGWLPVPPGHG